jgi:hypothetical protein
MYQSQEGEEIYEYSDTTSNINYDKIIENKNTIKAKIDTNDTNFVELETTPINADKAFQFFHGKLYRNPTNEYALVTTLEKKIESPLERLNRLNIEISDLQADLDIMVKVKHSTAIAYDMTASHYILFSNC